MTSQAPTDALHPRFTPHEVRRISVEAGCDPRTVLRHLTGGRVHSTIAGRISAVAAAPMAGQPTPPSGPFSATPQRPVTPRPMTLYGDQPPPPPNPPSFDPDYHGHTFRAVAAPIGFDGWSIDRIRSAIATHDAGIFIESSLLADVVSRFGPVFAALSQAIAPALALPRHVLGGVRGFARVMREAVEAQLAPRAGLLPSPYFPPIVWGSCALDLRRMGFAVLQHVYGEPHPLTGVRPVYTRRWPTWAVQYFRYRRTYVVQTDAGPIDIVSGDGKFTLLADTEEPHLDGAVRALGLEVLDGTMAKQMRAGWIDKYGDPKLWGEMPPDVAVHGDVGDECQKVMRTLIQPGGRGLVPHGMKLNWTALSGEASSAFKDALDNVWQFIAAILLGSDGTMTRGTGVYSAPIFAGVRRDLVDRMLKAIVRGINMGHVAPWLAFNFASSIAEAGGWIDPVLDIPLPDPDADARIKSLAEREASLVAQLNAERAAGLLITQERVNQLAAARDIDAPTLALVRPVEDWEVQNKIVTPDEVRIERGRPPLPGGVGGLDQLAAERRAGKDQAGGRFSTGFDVTKASAYVELGRAAGVQPDPANVAALLTGAGLGSQPIPEGTTPAAKIELTPGDNAKIIRVDEARQGQGLPPLGPPDGEKMVAEIGAGSPGASGGTPAPPGGNGGVPGGEPANPTP